METKKDVPSKKMCDNGDNVGNPLYEKVDSLKLAELKNKLKKRRMKTSGSKDELITRLKTVLTIEDELPYEVERKKVF